MKFSKLIIVQTVRTYERQLLNSTAKTAANIKCQIKCSYCDWSVEVMYDKTVVACSELVFFYITVQGLMEQHVSRPIRESSE
jgi:hypothetical protein